jgi:acyl carrier protein
VLEEILSIVKEVFSSYVDVSGLDADAPFDSFDIDSLVLVEVAITLRERLGFVDAERRVKDAGCVRDLAAFLAAPEGDELAMPDEAAA